MLGSSNIVPVVVGAAAALVLVVLLVRRYKVCPEGKLLVVYGARLPECFVVVASGGRFVLPVIQASTYLSLAPVQLPQPGYPRAVRIGSTPEMQRTAALQLLALSEPEIVARVLEVLGPPGSLPSHDAIRDRLAELGMEVAPA